MAVCGISFITSKLHIILSSSSSSSSSSIISPLHTKPKREAKEPTLTQTHSYNDSLGSKSSKRKFNLSILSLITLSIPTFIPNININNANAKQKEEEEEENLELDRYTDSKQGFTLLIPHYWIQVDKAGANVLFQEPNKSANNVGVVVNPVRLTKLEEFGTPEFVADKLIQVEKRKESTNDAEVISVSERTGKGGLQVYEFEYKVDSTRGGLKRIFSAAFVASNKLYILNISHSDKPESPLDLYRRAILQQIVHSFDSTEPMNS